MGVAALPLPGGQAESLPHAAAAIVALVTIAAWPAMAGRRDDALVLRPVVGAGMAAVLLLLVSWFFGSVLTEAPLLGLSERVAAGAQAAWPLLVVAALRRTSPSAAVAR